MRTSKQPVVVDNWKIVAKRYGGRTFEKVRQSLWASILTLRVSRAVTRVHAIPASNGRTSIASVRRYGIHHLFAFSAVNLSASCHLLQRFSISIFIRMC